MVINWYGEASFKITSGSLTIATDSFESSVGLTAPRFKSDLALKSSFSEKYISEKDSETRNIFGPGEYEVKGIEVRGFEAGRTAVYVVKVEDIKLGILGELTEKDLTAEAMEALQNVDILFIPAGGEPYIDVKSAISLIKKIEPKIVIPSLYMTSGLKRATGSLGDFAKALGYKTEEQDKLTIKAKDIIWEGTKLIAITI